MTFCIVCFFTVVATRRAFKVCLIIQDRRSAHERERSPRIDRNVRPSGDPFDRRRSSPREGSRGSVDRFPLRRDRERGGESFEDRHDKDRRKDYVGHPTMDSRMDRSGSREARISEKIAEDDHFKNLRGLDEGKFPVYPSE